MENTDIVNLYRTTLQNLDKRVQSSYEKTLVHIEKAVENGNFSCSLTIRDNVTRQKVKELLLQNGFKVKDCPIDDNDFGVSWNLSSDNDSVVNHGRILNYTVYLVAVIGIVSLIILYISKL